MNQKQRLRDSETAFWSWEPPGDPEKRFMCHHMPAKHIMSEVMCQARARKAELYGDICGGRPSCPRWKYYRKLTKKAMAEPVRKAYR